MYKNILLSTLVAISTLSITGTNNRHALFGGHNGDHVFGDVWIFKDKQ